MDLLRRDLDALDQHLCEAVEQGVDEGAHRVLLSTEGIYNHWPDYADWAGPWWRAVAGETTLRLWFVLRDPVEFASGLYQQTLRNPRVGHQANGTALTVETAFADPAFVDRLDYDAVVGWWEAVAGPHHVTLDVYSSSMASVARSTLELPELPWDLPPANTSLTGVGVALLRSLNTLPLRERDRAQVLEEVLAIERAVGDVQSPPPVLDEEQGRQARALTQPSLSRLVARRPEIAPLLRDAGP